jgi:DHA2 family multidrug resistance protein
MPMARLDPRVSMGVGFLAQVLSGYWLMQLDLNVTMSILALNSIVQGMAVGIIWVPLTQVTFETVAPEARAETTAVFHLLRNIGSSFFISLSVAEIVRTTGANYSRMTESISSFNPAMQQPWVTGAWTFDTVAGLARFAREINRQAALIGYLNAFLMYTAASAAALLLIVLVRRQRPRLA